MSISADERRRRVRNVRKHVLVALGTLLVLIPLNFALNRAYPWWLWVLMGWMPLLAAHTAWAMGLFERNKEGS